MDLILLPHHNTVTSLQKVQQTHVKTANERQGMLFIPAYPAVCVLAHAGRTDAGLSKGMQTLKDALKCADGSVCFSGPEFMPPFTSRTGKTGRTLIIPVSIPFMDKLEAAGFTPAAHPHIILGNRYCTEPETEAAAEKTASAIPELPAPSRVFRIALMQNEPLDRRTAPGSITLLSEAAPAASFSWKYSDAFWVKLRG